MTTIMRFPFEIKSMNKWCWKVLPGDKVKAQLFYTEYTSDIMKHKIVNAIVFEFSTTSLHLDLGKVSDHHGAIMMFDKGYKYITRLYFSDSVLPDTFLSDEMDFGRKDFLSCVVLLHLKPAYDATMCFLLIANELLIHRDVIPLIARLVYASHRVELKF